jgi:serine/threonine protein kinase
MLTTSQNKTILSNKYNVDYSQKLGQGAFGSVYLATHRETGEKVALKCIDKKYTDDSSFQREMNALLHLRLNGGHPNISGLREDFDDDKSYHLILDLVSGGEMFDHLVKQGSYSEADAARLFSEVASAISFLHGIGIVHGDLKPENLMLTSTKSSDSVIQVVDFGCAEVQNETPTLEQAPGPSGRTVAYSPPEAFDGKHTNADAALDMWALGVILYIMLSGMHPFDLEGTATDEEIESRVRNREAPPLDNSKVTAHLSDSSIDLIKKLMAWKPKNRLTAIEMLDHPWVKGETALTTKIEDSDTKLLHYRKFKSQIESKIFADLVKWADDQSSSNNSSLIERSFRSLDENGKGFLSLSDLQKTLSTDKKDSARTPTTLGKFLNMFSFVVETADNANSLSLSGFSNLVSESMKNKHFPKGQIVYKEGDNGDHMYFINSGTIEVSTKDGSVVQRKQGKFFGEGALLHPEGLR